MRKYPNAQTKSNTQAAQAAAQADIQKNQALNAGKAELDAIKSSN